MMGTEETLTRAAAAPTRGRVDGELGGLRIERRVERRELTGRAPDRLERSTAVMPMSSVERISSGLVGRRFQHAAFL